MTFEAKEWCNLLLRWTHVFAGILWVGTTYYFTWLDGRFSELERSANEPGAKPGEKEVWMVHSGGFYRVEKQKAPNVLPERLHWFRWEAAVTWLSGLLLFFLVYYDGRLLEEFEGGKLSHGAAITLSMVLIGAAWTLYDLLWNSKFLANELVGVLVGYVLVVVGAWLCFHYFTSRAACLQLGAMMGTIMTANVWMRILPAQKRMVAALKEGREPDQNEARRAKLRSKHNTFLVIPVVFLMLSNHFPGTYHWGVVSALVLAGWIVAMFLRRA